MNKKAFGLLFAISILLILSSLSVLIIQYKSTRNQLLVRENLYNQALLHLQSTKDMLHKMDLKNNSKSYIEVEDTQFEIKINLYKNLYKIDGNTKKQEMIRASIIIKSKVKEYENIRLTRVVNLHG
jgi:hypothetical protein